MLSAHLERLELERDRYADGAQEPSLRDLARTQLLLMEVVLSQLDDLTAALTAAAQHLSDTQTRVTNDVAALKKNVEDLTARVAAGQAPDLSAVIKSAQDLSASADAIDPAVAVVPPAALVESAGAAPTV